MYRTATCLIELICSSFYLTPLYFSYPIKSNVNYNIKFNFLLLILEETYCIVKDIMLIFDILFLVSEIYL